MNGYRRPQGFTIVELLIVIVVIGILAAVTIVAFAGITRQSESASLKSELQSAGKKIENYKTSNNAYPTSLLVAGVTTKDIIGYTYSTGVSTYCLQAIPTKAGAASYHITNEGTVRDGICPVPPFATTMQELTSVQCQSLTTFTGSNASAVIDLTDSRDGTTRTYQVARLADGNCWMLNNLKLGSTTTLLTPTDSNVSSNFTLPQLITTGTNEINLPRAYGPVTGSSSTGATNYGYLYNWSAATGGATTTTNPAGTNAASSICPAGWRLPTGGSGGEFAMLNAKMNNINATAPSTSGGAGFYQNWQNNSALKGVFSGFWRSGSFTEQGTSGLLWSNSVHASTVNEAYFAYIFNSYVYITASDTRDYGAALRCLHS